MNHLAHIAAHLGELDAMLLTSEANCYYAAGFMGEGVALVTRKGSWYFTDSRYTEAAEKAIGGAAVIGEIRRDKPFSALINDALAQTGAQKVGFEEQRMTVAEHTAYTEKLHCTLVPAYGVMTALRGSKDEEELATMTAAQRIAEGALEQICKEIRPGMTEKEIAARLNYLMVSAGAEKTSFDTIVASGPNGSMPPAVPGMRQVQQGDFITMDFGCVYKGYCSDMTRTVALASPPTRCGRSTTLFCRPSWRVSPLQRRALPVRPSTEQPARSSPTPGTALTSATASATVWASTFMSPPTPRPPTKSPCRRTRWSAPSRAFICRANSASASRM